MIDRIHDSEEWAQMQKPTRIVTLFLLLFLISGCSYFSVYKRDIPQGNLVTAGMVEQLRPGMPRQQVVEVMGSPLLEAPFEADEWDYVYRLEEAYGGVEQRRVTLTFDGNRLAEIAHGGDFSRAPALPENRGIGPASEAIDDAPQAPLDNVTPDRP